MPARFNLYSAWTDTYFYLWALLFAAALFALVYSVRRYLELKRAPGPAEDEVLPEAEVNPFLEEPAVSPAAAPEDEEKTLVMPPPGSMEDAAGETPAEEKTLIAPPPFTESGEEPVPAELPAAQAEAAQQEEPAPAEEAQPGLRPAAGEDHTRAENFVRGIYAGITDLDERMKTIEAALSKGHVNNDFTVKFLEDMVQDMDTLDKSKIKARLEYLLSDLKK